MKTLRDYAAACGDLVADAVGDLDVGIERVQNDSRAVRQGDLFVAIQGAQADGRAYIPQAVENGAAAIVYQADEPLSLRCPSLRVSDDYVAFGLLAELAYGFPARDLLMIGVTGTNGKTTTSFLLAEIFRKAGRKVGVIGTVHYDLGDEIITADRTTPTPLELQRLLSKMRENRVEVAILEVSSHALCQRRIGNIRFDAAVFTNLTPEHLDYHGDMEEYYQAKKRLFVNHVKRHGASILNIDDDYGKRLEKELPGRVLTYGFDDRADVRPQNCAMGIDGTKLLLTSGPIRSPLIGGYNAQNVMGAAACAWCCGMGEAAIRQAIENFPGVPGRLQRVPNTLKLNIFIDYAHTGDALENVLSSIKPLCAERLITVFGCGGNRDTSKRPVMGEIAARFADAVIVTTDNPRNENPQKIIDDILEGVPEGADVCSEPDRGKAIGRAVELANPGDTVIIAGKGHEDYQEIGGQKHPFNDLDATMDAIRRLVEKELQHVG